MGVNGNANPSEVLLQDGSSREASTSGRWITPLQSSGSRGLELRTPALNHQNKLSNFQLFCLQVIQDSTQFNVI